jgi:zinc protease
VRESQRREYELDLRQNGYWLSTLQFYLWHNEPLENLNQTLKYIEGLDKTAIQQAAKRYFDLNHYAKFVLLPEEQQP